MELSWRHQLFVWSSCRLLQLFSTSCQLQQYRIWHLFMQLRKTNRICHAVRTILWGEHYKWQLSICKRWFVLQVCIITKRQVYNSATYPDVFIMVSWNQWCQNQNGRHKIKLKYAAKFCLYVWIISNHIKVLCSSHNLFIFFLHFVHVSMCQIVNNFCFQLKIELIFFNW